MVSLVLALQCMLCAYKILSFPNHHPIFHMLVITFGTIYFELWHYVFIYFKENLLHFYPKCLTSSSFYFSNAPVLTCVRSELCALNNIA